MNITKRHWLAFIVLVLAIYVVLPQIGDFRQSLHFIGRASAYWLAWALVASLLTYLAAAGSYCWLAFKSLPFGRTVIMQAASTFANRLLPAGIGNMGVNYQYLRRNGHQPAQATAVVALNNGLGFVGHMLLLAGLLVASGRDLPGVHGSLRDRYWIVLLLLLPALTIILSSLPRLRHRLLLALKHTLKQVGSYRRRPERLLLALATSVGLTLCNVLCFWYCLHSLGLQFNLISTMLVFTFGVAIGTATPTPGGLGGTEAALVGGLVAFKVPQAEALAAVIIYRFIYYWLGLLTGGLAWLLIQHRRYLI